MATRSPGPAVAKRDRIYLIRLGEVPRGLITRGTIIQDGFFE
ncbi:hypothetical protein [Endozoicomonas arenosclerae]|nr:hypothetical protein [Endozoicomonas arenosclerae]